MNQAPSRPSRAAAREAVVAEVAADIAPSADRSADLAYRELIARLVTGRIAPGARISVDGTSRDLGVSQTPVREALNRLETVGLVRRVHLSGFRAAPLLTEDEFEKLFEARLLIEPYLARLAARRHDTEAETAIHGVADRMRSLAERIERITYGDFAVEDAQLHDLIAQTADSRPLRDALRRMNIHLHLFRLLYDASVSRDAIAEHDAVIEAIVARDGQAAAAAMRRHLRLSRSRLQQAYR